ERARWRVHQHACTPSGEAQALRRDSRCSRGCAGPRVMRVIAYTYEADWHCIACTKARTFRCDGTHPYAEPGLDENGIAMDLIDREGNVLHPVFSTDELPCHIPSSEGGYNPVSCGDCHDEI